MTDPKFQEWLSEHIFTASEFEAYRLCPFKFYVESYLGLKPSLAQEPELTPIEIGTLLHRILQLFYERHASEIASSPREKMQEALQKITSLTLESHQKDRPHLIPALLSMQTKRIESTLQHFLEKECMPRETGRSLKPAYFEWSFGRKTAPLELPDGKGETIQIKGRVDRIDVDVQSKRFLVIDYKTGSQKTTGNQIRRGGALQLPLYLLAVKKLLLPDFEPIGGLYYHLSDLSMDAGMIQTSLLPNDLEIHPSSSTFFSDSEWKEFFGNLPQRVGSITQEIRDEKFSSSDEACQPWCPWKDVCRIRASRSQLPHQK